MLLKMDNQQVPQKLKDFNSELEQLCKKYQYEVRAVIQPMVDQRFPGVNFGLAATLQAFDISPKEEGVPLNNAPVEDTTTEAPVVSEPPVETVPDEAKKNDQSSSETLPNPDPEDLPVDNNPVN